MIDTVRKAGSGIRVMANVALSLLVFCNQTGASSVKDDFKSGAHHEANGQLFRAAKAYLRVLRLTPADEKARTALARVGERAIAGQLAVAAVLETEMKFDEAISAVDAARRLRDQMVSLKIQPDQQGSIDARREQLVIRRVEALLTEADRARADLTENLVAESAAEATRLLPSAVDVEPAVPDPATIPLEH